MDKINPSEKFKRLERIGDLSKAIETKIKLLPDFNDLKFDPDIILYVCDIIENNIKQNEVKSFDKKQIVISILQKCYTFNSVELVDD